MPAKTIAGRLGAIAALAVVAAALTGCASTSRFLLDPETSAQLRIEKAATSFWAVAFDSSGGAYDPAARVVRGTDTQGRPCALPVAEVRRVTFRSPADTNREPVSADPQPLAKGATWRPGGKVQLVVRKDGGVLNLRQLPARVDPERKVVSYQLLSGARAEVPFTDVYYLQIRDGHPGRTVVCLLGLAWLGVSIGVALSGGYGITGG